MNPLAKIVLGLGGIGVAIWATLTIGKNRANVSDNKPPVVESKPETVAPEGTPVIVEPEPPVATTNDT